MEWYKDKPRAQKAEVGKEKPERVLNIVKILDVLFVAGCASWILFAWILPAVFNADNDVTMWMVFLTFALAIYAIGRIIAKVIQKAIDTID
jgi:hypothetical protein